MVFQCLTHNPFQEDIEEVVGETVLTYSTSSSEPAIYDFIDASSIPGLIIQLLLLFLFPSRVKEMLKILPAYRKYYPSIPLYLFGRYR